MQVPAQMQHFWIWCRVVKDINHEQEKERAGLHVFEGTFFSGADVQRGVLTVTSAALVRAIRTQSGGFHVIQINN